MLVRWVCSSPASEMLVRWVCKPRSSPASENAPLGKRCNKYVNQQAASFQRPPKMSAQFVLLSLDWARNAPYLDKVRVRGSCWTFMSKGQSSSQCSMVQRDLKKRKAKTKARHQSRGESPKGMKDLQWTKLGDDQERRPYPPKWRNTKEESYWPARRKSSG